MVTPIFRFTSLGNIIAGPNADITTLVEPRDGPDWVSSRLGANGVVSTACQQISVGKHCCGHNVDIQIQKEMVQIWDGAELIKSFFVTDQGR